MDTHPRMISHPYVPELNGSDLTDFKDQRGVRIFVEFVNVLKSSEDGYVEYVWQWKDDPGRLVPKESYIKKFPPWGWIVGTGLYVEDVHREIEAMEARMVHVSLGITLLSALLLVFVALQSMTIERRRRYAEDELHESHEKYRTLVEAATDGILMILDGRCTYANKRVVEMLNYTEAEFALLDLDDLFPEDSRVDSIGRILSDGRPIPQLCETFLCKRGGELVQAAITVTPISSAGRTGFILAARDLGARDLRDHERRHRDNQRENLIAELQTSLMFLHEPVSVCMTEIIECDMRDSILRATEFMTLRGSSAILVTSGGETTGIVTDQDIRERVVASSLSPAEPVFRVMSSPIAYIQHQCAVYEAILVMRERNLRHLVARDDTGQTVGIVDIRELLHFHRYSLAVLTQEVRQANSPDAIASFRRDLPRLVKSLIEGGARTRNITRSITTLSDTITSKLIHLAIVQVGVPPVRFAFLALGSVGREEQTLASDQDNAIIFDDVDDSALPAVQEYFLKIGDLVCNWLNLAGYPLCEGKIMAGNPKWCQPVRVWKRYFSDWIRDAEPQNILDTMTFFDFRVLHGEKGYAPLLHRHIDEELSKEPAFLMHYAQYALQYRIPIGFFGNIVVESAKDQPPTFNIKEGMMPVVNFARLYSLRHGVRETNTLDRIHELMELGILRKSLHDEALQVYDCLLQIRLRHQADASTQNLSPDNSINPKGLTHMEETLLKEAFAQIANIQKKISYDFLGGT
jgi:PAS domain S-box-containing protein